MRVVAWGTGVALAAMAAACSGGGSAPSYSPPRPSVTASTPQQAAPIERPAAIAACQANVVTVQSALAAYQATHGSYPPSLTRQKATGHGSWKPLLGNYLTSVPASPYYTVWFDHHGNVLIGGPAAKSAAGAQNVVPYPTACAYQVD